MPFKDIREFIAKCEELGELQRIEEEVDWDMEAGAIARRCCETSAPAPFFQKIKDYPKASRLLGEPLATFKRLAIALDLKPDASYTEILDAYDDRRRHPIKPILLDNGPCKENIYLGDEVDLLGFPVPMIHGWDGGRFIGTWHIVVTKDPDSEWVNWGIYRMQVHSKNTTGIAVLRTQHIAKMFFEKYEPRNMKMEIAAAIGVEPVCTFVGTSGVPYGISEVDIVGGIRREPIELVKCETVNLLVPASAEIVIEGEVLPNVRKDEGPFGEYTGYRNYPKTPRPVINVKAITHRNDPILTFSCMGIPVDSCDVAMGISVASDIRSALRDAGLPITGVYVPPESALTMGVVSTKTPAANIAYQIACCIWATKNGHWLHKVIVVDEDVDPTNFIQVMHAWITKCHPIKGVATIPGTAVSMPVYTPDEVREEMGINVVYDCTYPHSWPKEWRAIRSSFRDIYPEEVRKKVLDKWLKYGFKE